MSTEAGLHTHTKKQKQQLGPSEPKTCLSTTAAEVGWRSPMGTHARHPTDRPKGIRGCSPLLHLPLRERQRGGSDRHPRTTSERHTHICTQRHDSQLKRAHRPKKRHDGQLKRAHRPKKRHIGKLKRAHRPKKRHIGKLKRAHRPKKGATECADTNYFEFRIL